VPVALATEIVRDRQRFTALAGAWDALAECHRTPLALHAWYSAALAVQDDDRHQLCTVLIWEDDRLVAAAPLMKDGSRSPARLTAIDAFAGEPDRLLYRSPAALSALARACAGLRQPIVLRRLVANEADCAALATTLRTKAAVVCKPRHASTVVQLPSGFDRFEADMSSSRRATIRRKWRAAGREHGPIAAEFLNPKPGDLPAQMARIAAIEGAGWKGRAGTALAADRRMGGFIAQVAEANARTGKLVLAFLRIGGQDAACRLILRHGAAWFEIKIGFDETFARFSPGVLLMHETLREACRSGIQNYAFLGLREGWQDHWPHQVIEDCHLATYPLALSGARAIAADGWHALAMQVRRLRRGAS
jgi:CelD/BcsL family acetyltransferase involved in cellulose biosynthesis